MSRTFLKMCFEQNFILKIKSTSQSYPNTFKIGMKDNYDNTNANLTGIFNLLSTSVSQAQNISIASRFKSRILQNFKSIFRSNANWSVRNFWHFKVIHDHIIHIISEELEWTVCFSIYFGFYCFLPTFFQVFCVWSDKFPK